MLRKRMGGDPLLHKGGSSCSMFLPLALHSTAVLNSFNWFRLICTQSKGAMVEKCFRGTHVDHSEYDWYNCADGSYTTKRDLN